MSNIRILKISNNIFYFTPEICIDISKVNLSKGEIRFRSNGDIYLTVEVKSFNNETKSLFVKIIDYNPKDISGFIKQTTTSEIKRIYFEPVIWTEIEPLLSVHVKSKFIRENLIIDNSHAIQTGGSRKEKHSTTYDALNYHISKGYLEANPVTKDVDEEFYISYEDATFELGFGSFMYKSKALKTTVNLKIENSYILPEFDIIKKFFPKALGGHKKFKVKAIYSLSNNTIKSGQASSEEIERINDAIIESIENIRILNLTTKPIVRHPDKSLFTTDDILINFEQNLTKGTDPNFTDSEILKTILENQEVRNAKHLQYLSGSAHSPKQKLRFTLKPLFGFLFFIEGETKNHYCWELLNSHATYLWSFDKLESDIAFQYKRIEETINTIRDLKREKYKSAYRANQIDSDLVFSAVEHSNINSGLVDGFVEWKHKLKERLS